MKFDYYLGGSDGKKDQKTTEFIQANGSKTEGELPESRMDHCMVEYAGIVILMGGQYVIYYGQFCSIPESLCFSNLLEFFQKS